MRCSWFQVPHRGRLLLSSELVSFTYAPSTEGGKMPVSSPRHSSSFLSPSPVVGRSVGRWESHLPSAFPVA